MVVFTCNHCGDSLQKPRVEKHYSTTCSRNSKSLTCVDCHKDFRLEEYAAHTKCITETERYAAKGTVIGVPKGEKKQESWVETVTNVIAEQRNNVGPNIKKVFELMEKHNNIPRKRKPFINFLMSSSGGRINVKDIEAVWDILEKHTKNNTNTQRKPAINGVNNEDKSKTTEEKPKENGSESTENNEGKKKKNKKSKNKENNLNGTNEETIKTEEVTPVETETKQSKKKRKSKHSEPTEATEEVPEKKLKTEEIPEEVPSLEDTEKSSKKKKKRKSQPAEIAETNNHQETNGESLQEQKTEENGVEENNRFSWEETIKEILQKKPDGMKKDKLENKVFKKYEKVKGTIENKSKLIKKYNKKLKALTVSCDNELIKLVA